MTPRRVVALATSMVALCCTLTHVVTVRAIAVPTAAQLRWMADEVGAIGHFNMGTFEGCGIGDAWLEGPMVPGAIGLPPPETFAPTNVDPDSWVKALASFG